MWIKIATSTRAQEISSKFQEIIVKAQC
uniref:Uncharacterized protein n=1 Tax=Arundo donax TaxID=35708 RepID=A0A0A8Y175_ARUDO